MSIEEYAYSKLPPRLCLAVKTRGKPSEAYVTFFGLLTSKVARVRELKQALAVTMSK